MAAGLALVALLAGAVWYATREPEPGPTTEATPAPAPGGDAEQPPPEVAGGCTPEALAGAGALELGAAFELLALCGAEGDPEARFAVIDRAVDAGDARGLLALGRWYDPAEAETVGSSFTPDLAIAAGHYAAASAGGEPSAAALLAAVCGRLDLNDPLHELAKAQHCPED